MALPIHIKNLRVALPFQGMLVCLTALFLGACDDPVEPSDTPTDTGITISVAALNLEAIDDACYHLLIENKGASYGTAGDGNDVAVFGVPGEKGIGKAGGALCASQFGNAEGGNIAYVAPCDAHPDANTKDGDLVYNRVTLWVDGLYRLGLDISNDPNQSWRDPCPNGCSLDALCIENSDMPVEFNLTIMRNANQGFFDVAVNFENLYCAGKVDCVEQDGSPKRLLRDEDDERTLTVVAAMSCTSAESMGAEDPSKASHLYASELLLDCEGQDPISLPVNIDQQLFDLADEASPPPSPVVQLLVNMGLENLLDESITVGSDSLFWNLALGLRESPLSLPDEALLEGGACRLKWKVAVSKGPIEDVFERANLTFPYIDMDVPLTDSEGRLLCTQHPIEEGGPVDIRYTELGDALPDDFVFQLTHDGKHAEVSPFPSP